MIQKVLGFTVQVKKKSSVKNMIAANKAIVEHCLEAKSQNLGGQIFTVNQQIILSLELLRRMVF